MPDMADVIYCFCAASGVDDGHEDDGDRSADDTLGR